MCSDCGKPTTGLEDPTHCSSCNGENIKQEEDVLDTWFSSWLWPLSPFGWPDEEGQNQKDINYFYPSNVLITADEIIFLWVARMIMFGLKVKGQVPFRDIYFSATVCDKKGQKFSKTLGNGIEPMAVIDQHGADAVRFTGVSLAPLGSRIRMDVSDFDNGKRFVNKLWNATRFLLRYCSKDMQLKPLDKVSLDLPSKWIINDLRNTAAKIDKLFTDYRLNDGVECMYHFIWGSFCDWAVEAAKVALQSDDAEKKADTLSVMVYCLEGALRLAQPIIPFVTEELWQTLPAHPDWHRPASIIIADYPDAKKVPAFAEEGADWAKVQALVSGIRSTRQQVGISPKEKLKAFINSDDKHADLFSANKDFILALANIASIAAGSSITRPEQSLVHVGQGYECYLPAAGLVDFAKEKARLNAEISRIGKIVDGIDKKLSNESFVQRAPADVVQKTKDQRNNMADQRDNLSKNLAAIS